STSASRRARAAPATRPCWSPRPRGSGPSWAGGPGGTCAPWPPARGGSPRRAWRREGGRTLQGTGSRGGRPGGAGPRARPPPGRASLVGEHTDYNDGFVRPFALRQGITAAAARRGGRPARRLTLCSRQEPEAAVEVELDGLEPGRVTGWAAYPAGVAWALEAA